MQLAPGVIDHLISRLLHDLIVPVSATLNGIELVEEFGPRPNGGISQEALDLASSSARLSADRLMYFRLALVRRQWRGAQSPDRAPARGNLSRLAQDRIGNVHRRR
jgi:hypothetical protein